MQQTSAPSTEIRPVILALVRGNGKSVNDYLRGVAPLNLPVLLVMSEKIRSEFGHFTADLTSDSSPANRDTWRKLLDAPFISDHSAGVYMLSDGKTENALLDRAFTVARRQGFTHALLMPADCSYPAEQIPSMLAFCSRHPKSIVLGKRSRKGNQTTALTHLFMSLSQRLMLLESGVHADDAVCGMRVLPLAGIRRIKCGAHALGHSIELTVRAARNHVPVTQFAVTYGGNESKNGITIQELVNATLVHTGLMFTAIPRWPFQLAYWLSPFRAWRELRKAHTARSEFARGLAIGVFIACLPVYGVQSFLGLFAARKLNLNPLSVLTGTQLSWPPVTPVLIFLSVGIGHLLLHGSVPQIESWADLKTSLMSAATVKVWIGDWILGGFLLGLVLGALTYLGSLAMFRLMPTPEGSQV